MADEYIKRDDAIAEVSWYLNEFCECEYALKPLRGAMRRLPSADVQPVVRCKDCQFWNREHISCEGLARCITGESGVRYRGKNDFCSKGVRMDGGT